MRIYSEALLYGVFAGLCTLLNLGTQKLADACLSLTPLSPRFTILLGMAAGTGVGLVTKFILDKLIVFRHHAGSAPALVGKFALYTLFGVVTTAIFWGTELLFVWLWDAPVSRYVGGAIGLIAGYTVKYLLDRRFVFSDAR
jgi:putative flippase GtrA